MLGDRRRAFCGVTINKIDKVGRLRVKSAESVAFAAPVFPYATKRCVRIAFVFSSFYLCSGNSTSRTIKSTDSRNKNIYTSGCWEINVFFCGENFHTSKNSLHLYVWVSAPRENRETAIESLFFLKSYRSNQSLAVWTWVHCMHLKRRITAANSVNRESRHGFQPCRRQDGSCAVYIKLYMKRGTIFWRPHQGSLPRC